jgi:hypothetical protein
MTENRWKTGLIVLVTLAALAGSVMGGDAVFPGSYASWQVYGPLTTGWKFTPTQNLRVTKLALWLPAYWNARNGFIESRPISIWLASDPTTPVVSGTVPAGAKSANTAVGGYAYIDPDGGPVTLSAGSTYIIASFWAYGAQDPWVWGVSAGYWSDPVVGFTKCMESRAWTFEMPTTEWDMSVVCYWSANFEFEAVTNVPPVAADDAAQTEAGVPVTIDVLENDHDDDGDTLTVSSVGAATGGSTAINTDGTVTYTPNAGFAGSDEFSYTISDGSDTSTATVFVVVSPRNVLIDIKPGSTPNSINLGSNGVVPLAILSEADFDATTVDPATVSLAGAAVAMRGKANRLMASNEDVNGDERLDLVLQVETENLDPAQLQAGYGTIVGTTYDGVPIIGSDEITIVPPQ